MLIQRKGTARQSSAVTLLLPSLRGDTKNRPCRGLWRSTVSVVKHALSSLIHPDKARPLTKHILTIGIAALGAQGRQCGAREAERLPGTWERRVKYCFLLEELSLGHAGLLPKWREHPPSCRSCAELQNSQGQER